VSLQSPLGKVLGRGSAKEGTDHWWQQRLSAVALLFLGIWFLMSMAGLSDFSYSSMDEWLRQPMSAILMVLFCVSLGLHSTLGIQVVIEDYVHGPVLKLLALVMNKFVHIFLTVAAIVAIFVIATSATP